MDRLVRSGIIFPSASDVSCACQGGVARAVRVNREEPLGDIKKGYDHEPTVNPTLLKVTPSQVFKQVCDARCVVVSSAGTTELLGAVSFRSYMNRYSQRLGGGPKHLSSTQPGGGLAFISFVFYS